MCSQLQLLIKYIANPALFLNKCVNKSKQIVKIEMAFRFGGVTIGCRFPTGQDFQWMMIRSVKQADRLSSKKRAVE